jgi:hypothetical protein
MQSRQPSPAYRVEQHKAIAANQVEAAAASLGGQQERKLVLCRHKITMLLGLSEARVSGGSTL